MEEKLEARTVTDSPSDDEGGEIGSVLGIMVDKHEAIEQSVSVIKKGIATQLPPLKAAIDSDLTKEPIKSVELDGLSNLLTDSRVKAMIKSVAGTDTDNLIGQAVGAMNSSGSIEEKHKAFANGIKKLHSNFVDPQKQLLTKDDKTFDLAFSLVGLNRSALASFKNR